MGNVLIVGGSSGLGMELARLYLEQGHTVVVTGRKNPHKDKDAPLFVPFSLSSPDLEERAWNLVCRMPRIHQFVYAAGYYQEGMLTDLTANEVNQMVNVGLLAPTMFLQALLRAQERLDAFVAITSTSQWTPRLMEPMYTAVKAGLAALANSVSLDERVRQVLVAAPAAMATRFWEADGRDMSEMLDPKWVAGQVDEHLRAGDSYREVRILRDPARTEVFGSRR